MAQVDHYLDVWRHDDGLEPEYDWAIEHPGCKEILETENVAADGIPWIRGYECGIDYEIQWYGEEAIKDAETGEDFEFAQGRYRIAYDEYGTGEDHVAWVAVIERVGEPSDP